jgi:tRNA U38,U39,U40 pseudouridine synthase TruA
VCRGELDEKFIPNSLKNNTVNVALAPGDGLMLEKVCYDKYNALTANKKSDIMIKLVT